MSAVQREPRAPHATLRSPLDNSRPGFFEDPGIDQLFTIVLELAAEVSALRDRFYVAEQIAQQHGFPLYEQIERWSPAPDDAAAMATMRNDLLKRMFRTIDGQG